MKEAFEWLLIFLCLVFVMLFSGGWQSFQLRFDCLIGVASACDAISGTYPATHTTEEGE